MLVKLYANMVRDAVYAPNAADQDYVYIYEENIDASSVKVRLFVNTIKKEDDV
jgi:hypothetical protein